MPSSFDVTIKGSALATDGLTEGNVYDGLGLVTNGLIWSCPNIWYGPYNSNGLTAIATTWSLYPGGTTTVWTTIGASISTSWTEYSTYNIEDC